MTRRPALMAALLIALAGRTHAQEQYRLDPSGGWTPAAPERPASADEALIADARRALADDRPAAARDLLTPWIERYASQGHPLLSQAYLIRGDAHVALGREYTALYDYEEICLNHAGSPEFAKAVEREFDIGVRYLNGLRLRILGMRLSDATDIGIELLMRVQERLPGTPLAEKACIELADHFYRQRDLTAASEAYEIYAANFPNGPSIEKARQRRIYANIARYKGPNYDIAGLADAKALIEDYAARDPLAAQRAGLSDALLAKLDESSAAQGWERAQWYLRRDDAVSARATLRRLIDSHPRTVAAARALEELKRRGWAIEEPAPASPAAGTPASASTTTPTTAPTAPPAAPASPAEPAASPKNP